MTEDEKKLFREVHSRMQIGYAMIATERDRELKEVNTTEAILSLRGAFQHAATLPARPSSGLVEFYSALKNHR